MDGTTTPPAIPFYDLGVEEQIVMVEEYMVKDIPFTPTMQVFCDLMPTKDKVRIRRRVYTRKREAKKKTKQEFLARVEEQDTLLQDIHTRTHVLERKYDEQSIRLHALEHKYDELRVICRDILEALNDWETKHQTKR